MMSLECGTFGPGFTFNIFKKILLVQNFLLLHHHIMYVLKQNSKQKHEKQSSVLYFIK